MEINKQLDARHARRLRAEDKFLRGIDRREAVAEGMIGELSGGRCYVFPVGGKYREGTRSQLVAFLIRNRYA